MNSYLVGVVDCNYKAVHFLFILHMPSFLHDCYIIHWFTVCGCEGQARANSAVHSSCQWHVVYADDDKPRWTFIWWQHGVHSLAYV